jgi:streptogramin lyase
VEAAREHLRRPLDVVATDRERRHAPIVREPCVRARCTDGVRILLALAVFLLLVPTAAGKLPPPPTETAVVSTGRAPCGIAAHAGELWVGVYEAGVVLRLDRAGRVQRRHLVGRWACQVAVDAHAAWVTRDNANRVVRIDRRSGRLQAVRVASPYGLVLAFGSLWVTSFETGTVTRIDPRTARPTRVLDVGSNPTGIAACGGFVWVGHGRDATWLTRIDPRSGETRRFDVVVRTPRWPRCIRGELWVTTEREVLRVAPRTGALRAHFDLAGTLADTAGAPDGTVWVTNKERSLVHRIHPAVERVVDVFPAGPGALSLARFGRSMWISSFAGDDVRRYDP